MNLRPRFSLRTLGLLLTLLCIAIGGPIGYVRYRANRQRQAIARLTQLNVIVGLQTDAKTTWFTHQLRRWVDPDAFRRINNVTFRPTTQGLDEVIEQLPELADLRSIDCSTIELSNRHFESIAGIPTLSHLAVEKGTCTKQTARKLIENPNWELLALPQVRLDDALLAELGRQKKLLRLTFDAADASTSGLESLANCQGLQEVFIYHANGAGGFAKAIRRLPSMRMAIVLQSTVGPDDLAEFGDVGGLSLLHFYDCTVDSSKINRLANAKSLTSLEFFRSPIAKDAVATVCELPKLQILSLDSCLDDQNVTKLAALPALRILALSKTELTDEGLQQLAQIRTLNLVTLPVDTKCTEGGIRRLQEKAAIRVVVGKTMSDGMVYLPGGGTLDRRKPRNP
jgi:hypothetical protein